MDYKLNVKKKSSATYSAVDLFPDTSLDFALDFYDANNIDKIKVPVSISVSLPMTDNNVSIIDYDPSSSQYNNVPSTAFDFQLFIGTTEVLKGNFYVESYSYNNNTPVIDVRLVDKLQEIFSDAKALTFEDVYDNVSTTLSFDTFLSQYSTNVNTAPAKNDIILPYLDMCNDTEKFGYAARQFLQFGFDENKTGLIPAFKVQSFVSRFFSEAGVGVTSRFFELGSYGTSISDHEPEDMYMVLPTKIDAGSRTRTRGFYLVNGPLDLFRSQYTADATPNVSSAKEVDEYESTNQSYGWNWNSTAYSNPSDTTFGLEYRSPDKNEGDALTNAYFGSHMSYNSTTVPEDLVSGNARSLTTGNYVDFALPMIRVSSNNYAMVNNITPSTSTGKVAIVATLWVDGSPAQTYRMCNTDGTVKELNVSDATVVQGASTVSAYRVSVNNQWGQIDGSNWNRTFNMRWNHSDIGTFKWEEKEHPVVAGSTYAVSMGFELLEGAIDVEYVSSWSQSGTSGNGTPIGVPNTYNTASIEDEDIVKGIFLINYSNNLFTGELYLALKSTGEHNPYFEDDDVNIYWSLDNIKLTPFEVMKEVMLRFNLSAVYNQDDNTVIIDRFQDFRNSTVSDLQDKVDDADEVRVDVVTELAKSIRISTNQTGLYYDTFGYGEETLNQAGSSELNFSLKSRVYNKSLCGDETFTDVPNGLNEYEFGFTINKFTSHKDVGIVFGYIGQAQYSTRLRRARFVSKDDYLGLIYDVFRTHTFPKFQGEKPNTMPLYHYDENGDSTDLYTFFKGNDNILYYNKPTVKFNALLDKEYAFDIKNNYSVVSIPQVNGSNLIIKSVNGKMYDQGVYAEVEAIIL